MPMTMRLRMRCASRCHVRKVPSLRSLAARTQSEGVAGEAVDEANGRRMRVRSTAVGAGVAHNRRAPFSRRAIARAAALVLACTAHTVVAAHAGHRVAASGQMLHSAAPNL